MKISNENKLICEHTKKLHVFETSIRKSDRFDRTRSLRQQIELEQEANIKQTIRRLPCSVNDMLDFLRNKKGFEKTITELILCYIRQQIQSGQVYSENLRIFVKSNSYQSLNKQISIFFALLQHQGDSSPLLLETYFDFFYEECLRLNANRLMFKCLHLVTKNVKLNWIPLKHMKFLIKQTKQQDKFLTYDEQLNLYQTVAKNYPETIQQNYEIVNRLHQIVDNMDNLFVHWKAQNVLRLFISLSCMQQFKCSQTNNITNFSTLLWSTEMLKHLKLNIFYKQNQKIKFLSLLLLDNLIIQNGSGGLWKNNKNSYAECFCQQITKKQQNSYKMILVLSKTLLLMVRQVDYRQNLKNIFGNCQIDVIQLILVILQKFIQQKEIVQLVFLTLTFIVDNLQITSQSDFPKGLYEPDAIQIMKMTQLGQQFIENYLKLKQMRYNFKRWSSQDPLVKHLIDVPAHINKVTYSIY